MKGGFGAGIASFSGFSMNKPIQESKLSKDLFSNTAYVEDKNESSTGTGFSKASELSLASPLKQKSDYENITNISPDWKKDAEQKNEEQPKPPSLFGSLTQKVTPSCTVAFDKKSTVVSFTI
jgi:hypothetical protein